MAEYVGPLEASSIDSNLQSGYDLKQPLLSVVPIQAQPQPQLLPLPPGWLEMADPSGRTLYCNPTTGTTSWERPSVPQLPLGWMKSQTPDGKTIYIHAETQRCSYEFPSQPQASVSQPQAKIQPQIRPLNTQMPQITRYPTAPGKNATIGAPVLHRRQTAPVQALQDPLSVTVSVNTTMARKAVPGFNEALAVHQLSERNNSTVLTKKFAADLAVTTHAMKDATISGASLATRQAKVAGQIMVDPKKMQKMSKKMVIKTGAMGVKTGRALKSMMGEMVEAADKKGKYQPKDRHFIPYDGQVEYQMKVPVQHPAQVPMKTHEDEFQQQQQQQQQEASIVPRPHPAASQTTITGVPARRPVRPQSVIINGTMSLAQSYQGTVAATDNQFPATEIAQPCALNVQQAEQPGGENTVFQVGIEGQLNHNASNSATVKPPGSVQQATQTSTSVNLSSQIIAPNPLPVHSAPITEPTAAFLPASNSDLRPHPLRLSNPQTVVAQPHIANSYSLQAQASVIIQAPADNPAPPPYTQQAQTSGLPTSSQAVQRPPPRRRPAPSASHQPSQPGYSQQQPSVQYVVPSQEQGAFLASASGGGTVGYETYNFIQPQQSTVVYQDQQPAGYSMQPQMLAAQPQEQNIIIEQNQTIIQQQQVVNNDVLVIQQQGMTSNEYELYVQQDSMDAQQMGMYTEYTTYEEGVAGEEVMYAEAYTGEVYEEVEYDTQEVGGCEGVSGCEG
ncbi:hypothetical protein LTR84_009023 [Exophiala bonariae]|uniref:WW domain-containing protein n=1 Tax=Exophiala bonariae TaxID=1690606 RepID=A0AAV9MYR1_9EURO|nr:hypothetical protein LTR84_009023 [Exophiala bonariae]